MRASSKKLEIDNPSKVFSSYFSNNYEMILKNKIVYNIKYSP